MRQLIRYGVMGVVSNGAIYLVYLLLTALGVDSKIAMTLVYIFGTSIGFIGNRKWTFAHHGTSSHAVFRYVLAYFFGYLINLLILFIFVDYFNYPHQWIQALAIIIVAGLLFVILKYFVFHEKYNSP